MDLRKILGHTAVYRLWQSPFAQAKLSPLLRRSDVAPRRVLDVGCGPGTNTRIFAHADYLGVDLNPRYVADARRRHGRRFEVADVTGSFAENELPFDYILVNSLLHHLSTSEVRSVLERLRSLLTDDGQVHVLDLVLPAEGSPARLLARLDRGTFARPVEAWRELFTDYFEPVDLEPYSLGIFGITLWNMIYFKGRKRA